MTSLVTLNGRRDLVHAMQDHLQKELKAEEHRLARITTEAFDEVMAKYLKRLRADVEATGFRNAATLSKSWRAKRYPSQPSLSPAAYIYSSAAAIVDAFSLGLNIMAAGGKYLAIPINAAVPIVRNLNKAANRNRDGGRFATESSTVVRVATQLGVRLYFVPAIGRRPAMLEAPGLGPLFLLVRQVSPPQKMRGRALLEDMKRTWEADVGAAIERRL